MSRKIRFIGDIHGDFPWYLNNIKDVENSIQVGDFGLGFGDDPLEYRNPDYTKNHRFIRGNHDNPEQCRLHPNWIADGTIENGIAFIGGASSIDRQWRTPGLNWWPDEEISLFQHTLIRERVVIEKPHTIVSHDCPLEIIPMLFQNVLPFHSQTQFCLQEILVSCSSIKTWIFGHFHMSRDMVINGVRFVCLGINQHKDLEI